MPCKGSELHLAANLTELNQKSELPPNVLKLKPESLARTAGTVYSQGKDSLLLGDEEKAYINFMKYLNLYSAIKATLAYKKDKTYYDSMIDKASLLDAMDQAESISDSLKSRYEEREAKVTAAKMVSTNVSTNDDLDDLFSSSSTETVTTDKNGPAVNGAKTSESDITSPSITAVNLYQTIQSTSSSSQLLLVDTRSQSLYDESHIRLDSVDLVNIPDEHLSPGILVNKLRGKLTARSQSLFDARANYSRIILLDWDSKYNGLLPTTPLSILKDAIYKFDQQTKLASEPHMLDGGYEEWLKFYPMFSTNSSVRGSMVPKSALEMPDVSAIDYDLDFDKEEPPPVSQGQDEPAQPIAAPPVQLGLTNKFPSVDRSKKPSTQGAAAVKPANQLNGYQPVVNTNGTPPQHTNSQTHPIASVTLPASTTGSRLTPSATAAKVTPSTASTGIIPAAAARSAPTTAAPTPTVNRYLKPQPATRQPVNGLNDSDKRTEEELYTKLREQNRRMIAEAGDRLKQLNADRAQIADLTKMKQSESQAVADLMRQKKLLEQDIEKQQNKMTQAKQVQEEHDMASSTPQINRNLKPNLDDWELRLSQLEIEDDKLSSSDQQKIVEDKRKQDAKLRAEDQSRLIEEHNRQIKQEQANKEAERAKLKQHQDAEITRIADEQRISAEKEKLAEERRISVETARIAEEQRKSAEKARIAEEQRIAAERARIAEDQKLRDTRARNAEAERIKLLDDQRKAEAEQTRIAEERKKATAVAAAAAVTAKQADEQKRSAEIDRGLSTNELPTGWQRLLDNQGIPYYVNYHTGEKTMTAPKVQPPAKPATKAPPITPQPPVRRPQGSPPAMRSTTRLKSDETTFGVDGEISTTREAKSKMKKFSSIPNLTQLDDSITDNRPDALPLDRNNKPPPPPVARQQSLLQVATVDSRRLANLSPEYGSTTPGLTGLYNMGNTCYMNSALQCLSHTAPLYKYFADDTYALDINGQSTKGSQGAISTEFALLLKFLWTGNYRYIVPRDFKHVFGRKQPSFDHFKQMDSQEFLHILLDMFHEDLNSKGHLKVTANGEIPSTVPENKAAEMAYEQYKKFNDSVIVSLFTGLQKSTVLCCNCGEKSHTFDTFNSLPLEITTSRRTTLMQCLDQYLRVDVVEDYKCEKCHRKQSKRKLDLYTLPSVLLVFFKRFDQYSYQFSKKTNMIDFPETLNMTSNTGNKTYSLYGVVNHYGSLDTGHYTAFCKSMVNKKWQKFNDENVSTVRNSSDIKSSAAYILFYTSLSGSFL